MNNRVVVIEEPELLGIFNTLIEKAYASGYIKARQEIEAIKEEPKFGELLRGVKELKRYLEHKAYWTGSVNTLNKVASQLLAEGDRQGHSLVFRCRYIDHAFEIGFKFQPKKKQVNT